MICILKRERKEEDTGTYREGCHLMLVIEIRVLYLQVKGLQVLLAGEKNKESIHSSSKVKEFSFSFSKLPKGINTSDTLILDFWTPELGGNVFFFFGVSHLVCGNLLRQSWEANTDSFLMPVCGKCLPCQGVSANS